jgi:DNA/RNA endonuclease YhcR with UshA esterase domain
MKKHLFGVAILMIMALASSFAFAVTIDEIQVYTAAGVPASPYNLQTVTVTGTLLEFHKYSTGSGYLIGAGGPGIGLFGGTGDVVAIGDEVSVTGTVGSFSGEIQINVTNYTLISAGPHPLTPELKTIAQTMSSYENVGHYGAIVGTVARKTTSGTPPLVSANIWVKTGAPTSLTDSILVYCDKDCQIDVGNVAVGDLFQFSGPIVTFNTQIEIKPVLQTDLIENPGGDTAPVITAVNCNNWCPLSTTAVTVSANIVDNVGVTSAFLFYRNSDGVSPGGWNQMAMSAAGSTYSATIPGAHSASQVDFYIQATDTGAQTVKNPGNAPTSFFTFAVGFQSIYAMQYAHPDSASQSNVFNNKFLNIKGVVTAGTGAATNAASKFVVQELAVNPATSSYAFGGVLVYEGSGKYPYYQGDVVEIGGKGGEYYGLTEMLPHNAEAVNLVSFGQALPVPARVHTRVLNDDMVSSDGNGALGEAWESVWVQTYNAAVMDTAGLAQYHEFQVSDTAALADTLFVDPYPVLAYTPHPGNWITVNSFVDYEFGNFKLRPADDSFIALVNGPSGVGNDIPTIEKLGGFKSISPNPFNPQTSIKFVVTKNNLVQLNVYNIRGEKVRTLIQDSLPANTYDVSWNGTDDAGKSVASGSYFARLRIGKEVMQVRSMQLVK